MAQSLRTPKSNSSDIYLKGKAMQKSMTVVKGSSSSKLQSAHLQTEELITDARAVLTPSQRVEEKLAACVGLPHLLTRRSDYSANPRRPR